MGSYISTCTCTGKIVLPDGTLLTLDRTIQVAELMLEYPQTLVVEFRSHSPSKLLPLPADCKLDPSRVYLVVPMGRGRANGMPVEEARRILLGNRPTKIPLFFGMCMARNGNGEPKERATEAERGEEVDREFVEKTEFLGRQYSSKGWKPSLGTIEERSFEKMRHWILL